VDAIGARTDLVYNEPPPDALLHKQSKEWF
jgi:hypothetical protein